MEHGFATLCLRTSDSKLRWPRHVASQVFKSLINRTAVNNTKHKLIQRMITPIFENMNSKRSKRRTRAPFALQKLEDALEKLGSWCLALDHCLWVLAVLGVPSSSGLAPGGGLGKFCPKDFNVGNPSNHTFCEAGKLGPLRFDCLSLGSLVKPL